MQTIQLSDQQAQSQFQLVVALAAHTDAEIRAALNVPLIAAYVRNDMHRTANYCTVLNKAHAGELSSQVNLASLEGRFHVRAIGGHTLAQLRAQSCEDLEARRIFIRTQNGYKAEALRIEKIQRERKPIKPPQAEPPMRSLYEEWNDPHERRIREGYVADEKEQTEADAALIPTQWDLWFKNIKCGDKSGHLYRSGNQWKWRGQIFTADTLVEALKLLRSETALAQAQEVA